MIGLFGGSWKLVWLPKYACYSGLISSVKSLSDVRLFVTPWTVCQASLSITNSRSLLKLTSMESVMPSNHLILCCPLFLKNEKKICFIGHVNDINRPFPINPTPPYSAKPQI